VDIDEDPGSEICEDPGSQNVDPAVLLSDPKHPIWKAILSLIGILTVLWTQQGSI